MTPLLLHGPAKAASRKKLLELKQKFDQNNVVVYEDGTDIGTILTNLQSVSLFDEERLIVLENPPEDLFSCNLSSVACTLILWFDHEIDSKKYAGLPAGRQRFEQLFFPEAREVSVFPLLDYLALGDQKAFLEIEKLKDANFDIHYFLTMTLYLLRNLTVTPVNAPQFVKEKLQRQRKNFDPKKIAFLYKDILEIDFNIKSGLLEKPQAEFLLVNKFLDFNY